MRQNAHPVRAISSRLDPLFIYAEITTAAGVVTNVKMPTGFSIASLGTGVALVSFPRHFTTFMLVSGAEDARGTPTTEHTYDLKTVNLLAGTAVLVCSDKLAGNEEPPANGTQRFLFFATE